MVIGIDASRAYISDKTGTENYSYHVISEMLRLPESKPHTFVLFIRPNTQVPAELGGFTNVIVKVIPFRYLWTQVGLAWETWRHPQLDALWIPAHTLPILRRPDVKTVVTIHGLEYQWLPEYKNLLQRWYLPLSTFYAAKSADTLIAVSQFTANQLKKELLTSSKKIKVIHEGVMADSRREKIDARKLLNTYGVERKRYVLFVGSIQPRKNLVALIEAFSKLNIPDLKLVIAGGTGWMAEEVFRAPGQYGIQEKVVLTGRVSETELAALYQGAALYVQPSLTEGFGLPLLEAMSHGIPVVTSDGGALKEVVGSAGLIVPLKNGSLLYKEPFFVKQLSAAMNRVLGDQTLQNNLVAMGYKRVASMSWSSAAKKTFRVLLG